MLQAFVFFFFIVEFKSFTPFLNVDIVEDNPIMVL